NRVLEQLQERRFETGSASTPEAEQTARELGKVARGLQRSTSPREDDVDTLYFQRVVRPGLLAAILIASVVGVGALRDAIERRGDLSVGKPWVASSSYETVCRSPSHRCDAEKSYFFHTQEEDRPWLEIDLQSVRPFSKVHVFNRQDCCAERAVPLVVEVSSNHQDWREVARKRETFDDWKASFPTVSARWVRLRVAGRSILHLNDVRVLK
ncbi:MAG TPA: discoidin domain-containing protein, partial [Polyangiaceae bacterium]|nr:discoidin domain-containing protein [Polyangiaceae bacterium]